MIHLDYELDGCARRVTLRPGTQVAGRSATTDILLSHASVSGQHASLTLLNGNEIHVKDLMSRNGVVVNGRKVPEAILHHGDEVRLGIIRLRVFDDEAGRDATSSGDTIVMEERPPQMQTDSKYRQPTRQMDSAGVPDDATPPGGTFLPEVRAERHGAVQVIVPAEAADVTGDPAQKRKRIMYIAAAALVLITAIVILLPEGKPARQDTAPVEAKPKKADYEEKLLSGIRQFEAGQYDGAAATWNAAQDVYKQLYPTKSGDKASRVLARIAKEFSDVKARKAWSELRWLELAGLARQLDEEAVLPDELSAFIEKFYRRAAQETDSAKKLDSARAELDARRFEEALALTAGVPQDSVYRPAAEALGRDAGAAAFARDRDNALLIGNSGNWEQAIATARALLAKQKDPQLEAAIQKWSRSSSDAKTMARAAELAREKDPARLREALSLAKGIAADSPQSAEARNLERSVSEQLLSMSILAYWLAADGAGLKSLAASEASAASNPELTTALRNLDRMAKLMADAEKELAAKKYFDARGKWTQVKAIAAVPEHQCSRDAELRLTEWSLERIGALYIEQGDAAYEKQEFKKAREAFAVARDQCKMGIEPSLKKLKDEAQRLWNAAFRDFNSGQNVAGVLKLQQARDCLEPSDELYNKIENQLKLKQVQQ